jgi:hypothetical protein
MKSPNDAFLRMYPIMKKYMTNRISGLSLKADETSYMIPNTHNPRTFQHAPVECDFCTAYVYMERQMGHNGYSKLS